MVCEFCDSFELIHMEKQSFLLAMKQDSGFHVCPWCEPEVDQLQKQYALEDAHVNSNTAVKESAVIIKGLRDYRLADQGIRHYQAMHQRTKRNRRRRREKKHKLSKEQLIEDKWNLYYNEHKWTLCDLWQGLLSDIDD